MSAETHLYLSYLSEDDGHLVVPIKTFICIFVINYCKNCPAMIYFVQDSSSSSHFTLPKSATQNWTIQMTTKENIAKDVLKSDLPAIFLFQHRFCVTGLCSVLRHLIKSMTSLEVKDILGFRSNCLMACSEVSVWTRFCEEEIPAAVDIFHAETGSHVMNHDEIPNVLLKFEAHLNEPVHVHNVNKHRQILAAKETQELNFYDKKSTIDLPEMPHTFAEGFTLTLSDLIIFVGLHFILIKLQPITSALWNCCPLVINWFIMMSNHLDDVIKTCSLKTVDLSRQTSYDQSLLKEVEVLQGSIYIRDSRKTHRLNFTSTDLSEMNNKLKERNITPQFEDVDELTSPTIDWIQYPDAVRPLYGSPDNPRVYRKCQQVENVIHQVVSIAKPGQIIVDFCSGGGHLGIALAYFLPQCEIILVENKEASLRQAVERLLELSLHNVFIYQGNLTYFVGEFDIGVSLHACGVATDMIVERCLQVEASFIICPCCYGAIYKTSRISYPRSVHFKQAGITYKDFLLLGHCADQSDIICCEKGKYYMKLVDTDRALRAQEKGYHVMLRSLRPLDCTPKNNLIIAISPKFKTAIQM